MYQLNLEYKVNENQRESICDVVMYVNRTKDPIHTVTNKVNNLIDKDYLFVGNGANHVFVSDKETGNRILLITLK